LFKKTFYFFSLTDVRTCLTHIDGCQFSTAAIQQLANTTEGTVTFGDVFKLLKSGVKETCQCSLLSFDKKLSNKNYRTLTGLTLSQFDNLLSHLPFRDKDVWTPRNSLGVYLVKMRIGSV
jgi:hypothetical protein